MGHSTEALLDVGLDAVMQASAVCRLVQRKLADVRAMTKDDRSPVTVADFASQAIVAGILAEFDAGVALVGEESAEFLRSKEHAAHLYATVEALRESRVWPDATEKDVLAAVDRGAGEPNAEGFWTLDPVDGTKGFLRGEQYCVSLAFVRGGIVECGVLGCPNLSADSHDSPERRTDVGSYYTAARGDGAMMHWEQDQAMVETNIERGEVDEDLGARMAESAEPAHTRQDVSAEVMQKAGKVRTPIRIDSQCKYALLARGDADVYLRLPSKKGYVERIWDHAAGMLIAREAGCTVTDVLGRELDFSCGRGLEKNTGIVGAPAGWHGRLVRVVGEMGVGR